MTMIKKFTLCLVAALLPGTALLAGNPDRIGESGAPELLINPWAASSGMNGINVASGRA